MVYSIVKIYLNFEVTIFSCFEHASIRAKKKYVTKNLNKNI